ncbi:MAG: hypothetical protein JWO32_655 [Bacteroidetes bacterium]|nr:hypothetical protein [Bacteroidota bacterium]
MISKNQIKQIQSLHQKKFRDQNNLFLVEGIKTVTELIDTAPDLISEVFGTDAFINNVSEKLLRCNIKWHVVSDYELEQISSLSSPNKVLAVCNYIKPPKINLDFGKNFSLYLDDIRDPGNFGTIVRLADWYGVSAIFCSSTSCDLYNPKVIQATMGAFLRVSVIYESLQDVIEKHNAKLVYGAVLSGKNIYKEKLENGLIVIGNEANGITENNMRYITHPLTIPSHKENGSESLNAAMACGIITSEFFRQLTQ